MAIPKLETIKLEVTSEGVAIIAFNRPKRYNALSPQAYQDWHDAIQWAAQTDKVKVAVLTGVGKYYTSGQELVPPSSPQGDETLEQVIARRSAVTRSVIDAMIDFPKVLIAAVNGPAIGFGVTTLALCDVVYTVPHATFRTPFMELGFCAEGCSSHLFPLIMGMSKANEILLMGRTFTAQELVECGMVSRLIPEENFMAEILKVAGSVAKLPPQALQQTKSLVRGKGCVADRSLLKQVNEREIRLLVERMMSEESLERVMAFMQAQEAKRQAKQKSKL